MKRKPISTLLAAAAATLLGAGGLPAQPLPQYELTIANPVLSGPTYRFDIFVRRVGATDFRIGNSQFILTFDDGAFTAPALSRVPASEQIGSGFFFDQVVSGNELRISLGGNHSHAAATDIAATGIGTRVSTFEISGVSVPVLSASLAWVNLPAVVRTGVSEIDAANDYRDITGTSHVDGGGEFGSISGYKFEDLDGDGSWEPPAEPGLDGWTITVNGPNGPASAVTGNGAWPSGYYEFVNLTPGSYAITEQLQPGWSPTFAPASPILLAAGGSSTDNNFGNFHGPTARGTVFRDLDGDGMRDPGEPAVEGRTVEASGVSVPGLKTQATSALGEFVFTFAPVEAGVWRFSCPDVAGWVRTTPPTPPWHEANVQSGSAVLGLDFGVFLSSSISGMKFDDADGDSLFGPGDSPLEGWLVTLSRDASFYDTVRTGPSGAFSFDSLPSGIYTLAEELPAGWTQLLPGSPAAYTFINDTGGYAFAPADFGNFRYGTMSGEVYFDLNHNGARDPGEAGMTGIDVLLNGPKTSRTVTSGLNGAWSVPDLLADDLVVTEDVPPGYLLTEPAGGSYARQVRSGTAADSLFFGNSSTTDTVKFRTMTYDSLVESRDRKGKLLAPEKRKPDKVEFCMRIRNNTGREVDGLLVRLRIPIYHDDPLYPLSVTPTPDDVVYSPGSKNLLLRWNDKIGPDSSVDVCAWGTKPKRYPDTYHHWYQGGLMLNRSTPVFSASTFLAYRIPKPNRMNVVDEIYRSGAFPAGILVGVERTDMRTFFAWARLRKLNDYRKSVMERFVVHTVTPRNFYDFDNHRRMTGEQKKVSPRKHNNRIFAEALTLRTSIVASQLAIFPPGLGELIYEEGANPLSGKTILQIAAVADTMLTNWSGWTPAQYLNLDSTLRKINAAFEGPIDTFSFATDLRLTGTRPLAEVPYLRANPGAEPLVIDWERGPEEAAPDRFTLLQNYPNPFNPVTTISFELPSPAVVTMKVYDVLGAEVGTAIDGEELDEGLQEIDFEAGSLPTGIYFYRITAATFDWETGERGTVLSETKKMMLVK